MTSGSRRRDAGMQVYGAAIDMGCGSYNCNIHIYSRIAPQFDYTTCNPSTRSMLGGMQLESRAGPQAHTTTHRPTLLSASKHTRRPTLLSASGRARRPTSRPGYEPDREKLEPGYTTRR